LNNTAESKKNAGADGSMDTIEKMRFTAGLLDEKQANDIAALDVAGICGIAEGLVIVSASSVRHAQALADHLLAAAKEHGVEYMGMEGYKGGSWILVDLNDVLVHIFHPETRQFYNLEGLWSEAGRVDTGLEGAGPNESE
jgi:ribosome-associated protein